MKPKFLLDEHISPVVARLLGEAGVDAVTVVAAGLAGLDDKVLLQEAAVRERILVTYNVRDFVPLLQEFTDSSRATLGVVLIDNRTIPSGSHQEIAAALASLSRELAAGRRSAIFGLFLNRPPSTPGRAGH